uniref:hypothetical protein n=1 Tax=Fulvivirga sp. TaxID=1931237 RepID=UPI00404B20A5
MRFIKFAVHVLIFILLTVATQLGGILYLLTVVIDRKIKINFKKSFALFVGLYLSASLLLVPLLASIFGRVALPLSGSLQPLNVMTCLLNRHYVRPELKSDLLTISNKINSRYPGTKTSYLDANFPFFNGFPLFPHLSHNDGKKVDLAFYYDEKTSGRLTNGAPSFIGYGIYEAPKAHEANYPQLCRDKGYWQYGFLTNLIPKWSENKYQVNAEKTAELISMLAANQSISKIFIEPHLKQRWSLSSIDKIRFHGCQAVRHDDHIHLQIK